MDNTLFVSSSPHVHGNASTSRIMWTVVATLMPATIWSIYLFGLPALQVALSTILFCVIAEVACQLISSKPITIRDGSAVLTGLILALTLPPGLPIWICGVGAVVAIVVTKAFFGGLGQNPFNPAMTGRVFLLIAFPGPLTRWLVPTGSLGDTTLFGHPVTALDASGKVVATGSAAVDAVTAATPLGLLMENGTQAIASLSSGTDLFIGTINGSSGETSALFLLLGGVFLIIRKIITWHIPVSFLAAMAVFAGITHALNDAAYAGIVFHLFSGGAIIGAFFMATDYVTSPMYPAGKLIFGAGCGLLTMVIRLWAGYPEGVSFAVLLMNAAVPIIDTYTKPKKFGWQHLTEKGGA
ncbi:MAG: RnfABCDGE type electron transport complex subunit D [Myxococcota bacterium]|nr:RnfABCDGE type electron transport complex subunit D [Myxococcota bacterium]